MENDAGTVLYASDVQVDRILSDFDHDHQIASIGRKEISKLAFILNKNSPYKTMFEQVQCFFVKISIPNQISLSLTEPFFTFPFMYWPNINTFKFFWLSFYLHIKEITHKAGQSPGVLRTWGKFL